MSESKVTEGGALPRAPLTPEVDALVKISNASYEELRPLVERYALDVDGGGHTYRSHATAREWEVARNVAGYLQGIAVRVLAEIARDASGRPPECVCGLSHCEPGIVHAAWCPARADRKTGPQENP